MAAKKKDPVILEDVEIAPEILTDSIIEVAKAAKKLLSTRLNDEVLYLLIQHAIKPASYRPNLEQIRLVMEHASKLDKLLLKPEKK